MCSKEVKVASVETQYENPVAELVQVACQFGSTIMLVNNNRRINAKSIMGIMAFNPHAGMDVCIEAEGKDEEDAVAALEKFLVCY